MRIAVHASVLSEGHLFGQGYYVYNLLKNIARLDHRNEYVLYSNKPLVHKINGCGFEEKILRFPKLWSYLRLPFEFVGDRYDLLFVPKEMVPPVKRPPTVITVYDLMGLMFPNRVTFQAKMHFRLAVWHHIKKADRVIAISQATAGEVLQVCGVPPDKVVVTPLGYDSELYRVCDDPAAIDLVKRKYGIAGPYLINTSSLIWYRKNLTRLVKAFWICKSRGLTGYKLVVTGKQGEAYREVVTLVQELGLSDDVIMTGYIPLEDMPLLLNGATVLVFPSLHEGFGLPVLEAMACGCPVVTSNCSALPEVVGDAGLLVDPHSVEEIAAAIEKVVFDRRLREEMRQKGLVRAKLFSWEKTARETIRVFESVR